jgi:hypothetical protein
VAKIKIEPSRETFQVLTVRVAIDLVIYVRIVFSDRIQALIVVDDGMDAKQIRSFEPEARKTKT